MGTLGRRTAKLWLVMLFVVMGTAWAQAEIEAASDGAGFGKRFALVIGNGTYKHAEVLPNAVRDATRIADELTALQFEVFKGTDLDKAQFERLVKEFRRASKDADAVAFYYAGHGFQLGGLNHLVPVDAAMQDRSLIGSETVVVDSILAAIHGPQRQTMVFLDACRNNPLPAKLRDESTGEGLAQLKTRDDGLYIAFATQPGNTSRDGTGLHSPFTGALLRHIAQPGQSISDLMIKVRNEVSSATLNQQLPWDQSSLRAQFYFNPEAETVVADARPSVDEGVRSGSGAFRSNNPEDVRQPTFLINRPAGTAAGDASQAEGDDADRDESSSDGAKVASLDPGSSNSLAVPNQFTTSTDIPGERELTVEIQRHLNRLGCNAGTADGVWGPATSRSAESFNRHGDGQIDPSGPDMASLDVLERQNGAICPKACGRGTVEKNGVCVAAAPPSPEPTRQKKTKKQVVDKKPPAKAQNSEPQTTIGSGVGVGSFF